MKEPKYQVFVKVPNSQHQTYSGIYPVAIIDFVNRMVVVSRGSVFATQYFLFDDVELRVSLGFNDINGKEIFSGDIVRHVFKKESGEWVEDFRTVVTYSENGLNWNVWPPHAPDVNNWEVVGNVYQNPELMKKEVNHAT